MLQRRQQRRDGRLVQTTHPLGQVADLHGTGVGDVDPLDPGGAGGLVEPGAVAFGTGGERHRPLHERPDVRLHRLLVLGEERLLDARHQPLVGQVDAIDLHLGRLPVEEVPALLLGVVADRLVRVEEARGREDAHVPAVRRVARDGQRAPGERLRVVVQLREVDVGHRSHAFAARAHAAGGREHASLGLLRGALLDRDAPGPTDRRDVEGERSGRADVRLAEAAEQHPQQRVGVGHRADRGSGVGAHALLVDQDRGRQPFQDVDLGPRQRRHEALHEGAVGLVDQPLRLRGDGAEHERALARAGDAGEHRQPALRDLDADVFEVVLARALHADQFVAVGTVQRRRLRVRPRGLAHRVSICPAGPLSRSGSLCLGVPGTPTAKPPPADVRGADCRHRRRSRRNLPCGEVSSGPHALHSLSSPR